MFSPVQYIHTSRICKLYPVWVFKETCFNEFATRRNGQILAFGGKQIGTKPSIGGCKGGTVPQIQLHLRLGRKISVGPIFSGLILARMRCRQNLQTVSSIPQEFGGIQTIHMIAGGRHNQSSSLLSRRFVVVVVVDDDQDDDDPLNSAS